MGHLEDFNKFTTRSVLESISGINLSTSLMSRIADFIIKFSSSLVLFYSIIYLIYYKRIIEQYLFVDNEIYGLMSLALTFVFGFSILADLRKSSLRFVRRNTFTKILSVLFFNVKYIFLFTFLLLFRPMWYFSLLVEGDNLVNEPQMLFMGIFVLSLLITIFWFLAAIHLDERKLILIDTTTDLGELEDLQLIQFSSTTNIYYRDRLTFYVHQLEFGNITIIRETSLAQKLIEVIDEKAHQRKK